MKLKKPEKKMNRNDILEDMSQLEPEALETLLTQLRNQIIKKINNIKEILIYNNQKSREKGNNLRRDLKKRQ
jgi:hypothetical protein